MESDSVTSACKVALLSSTATSAFSTFVIPATRNTLNQSQYKTRVSLLVKRCEIDMIYHIYGDFVIENFLLLIS